MANIHIKGILRDPMEVLATNVPIRVTTVIGFGETLQSAVATYATNGGGDYDFPLVYGSHRLEVRFEDKFVHLGDVVINSTLTGPLTISQLLQLTVPVLPPVIEEMNRILAEANAAAAAAKTSEVNAAASAKVASDAEAAITPMYNYFNANYPTFDVNYQDFAVKYPDVVAKHGEVVTLAAETVTNADLAQKWASNPEDTPVVPDKYSALHWAIKAQYNANQTYISGGLFTPTVQQEYPDVSGVVRDTIWINEFATSGDSYTFTTGDLVGKTTSNADMMFYDTPSNSWSLIPTAVSGGIVSVDGDTGPNVNLESKYFWSGNKPIIADVDGLQGELDGKYSDANHPTIGDVDGLQSNLTSIENQQAINTNAIASINNVSTVSVANSMGDASLVVFTRSGNLVTCHWSVVTPRTVNNGVVLVSIPVGFRPFSSEDGAEYASTSTSQDASSSIRWILNATVDTLTSWDWTRSSAPRFQAAWITRD